MFGIMHTGAVEVLWRVGSIRKVPNIWVKRALNGRAHSGDVRGPLGANEQK